MRFFREHRRDGKWLLPLLLGLMVVYAAHGVTAPDVSSLRAPRPDSHKEAKLRTFTTVEDRLKPVQPRLAKPFFPALPGGEISSCRPAVPVGRTSLCRAEPVLFRVVTVRPARAPPA